MDDNLKSCIVSRELEYRELKSTAVKAGKWSEKAVRVNAKLTRNRAVSAVISGNSVKIETKSFLSEISKAK